MIAVAAVRYFMVKFSRGKVIAFDIDEALSFEGESGPYLQYAVVAREQHLREAEGPRGARRGGRPGGAARHRPDADRRRQRRRPRAVGAGARGRAARRSRRPGDSHAGAVGASRSTRSRSAQQFNGFYHAFPILKEERADVRLWRAAAVGLLPPAAHAGARPDGLRRAGADVAEPMRESRMAAGLRCTESQNDLSSASRRCSRVDDYVESVKRAGGEPLVLEPARRSGAQSWTASTRCS